MPPFTTKSPGNKMPSEWTVELSSYSGNFYIHAVLIKFWHHFVDWKRWEEWQVVAGSLATVSSPAEQYM